MRQMDFYFHDDCLAQQSVLLLARELQAGMGSGMTNDFLWIGLNVTISHYSC